MLIAQSTFGLAVLVFLAWLFSEQRSRFPWKLVLIGLSLQLGIALALLKLPTTQTLFMMFNGLVLALEQATQAGTQMVFGYLGGGELPFDEPHPGAGYILAFRALPMVLVISALSTLLFYWKILPRIVQAFSLVLRRGFSLGGAEGLAVAANIFVGMVESPLFIRPYVQKLTRSELFTIMTCGMATIAGTMMALYAAILGNTIPNALGHILVASLISAPAAILIAKVMIPETAPVTDGRLETDRSINSSMDAITHGTVQGVQLLINIVAMLIVMVALVKLLNLGLGQITVGGQTLSLEALAGLVLAPLAWLIGIPWEEARIAGSLLGVKTIINEFVAYLQMAALEPGLLSERSKIIMSYALCGFANPGSVGIMVAGMSVMAPERRSEIVSLGFRSLYAGTLATCMTGAMVALLL